MPIFYLCLFFNASQLSGMTHSQTMTHSCSSVSPLGTALPLVLVLAVTMIKDGYDDLQRHKQDRYLNNKKTLKINKSGKLEEIAWQDIMTGNLVIVNKDEGIPADLVLLGSTDEEGLGFIETAELDGETNLKIKQSLRDANDTMNLTKWNSNDFTDLG